MKNTTSEILRRTGIIVIVMGAIVGIIMAVADYIVTPWPMICGIWASSFVSGMLIIGISEIIFLLTQSASAQETQREMIEKWIESASKTSKTMNINVPSVTDSCINAKPQQTEVAVVDASSKDDQKKCVVPTVKGDEIVCPNCLTIQRSNRSRCFKCAAFFVDNN